MPRNFTNPQTGCLHLLDRLKQLQPLLMALENCFGLHLRNPGSHQNAVSSLHWQ